MVIVLERKTHFYIAIHIPDHSATSILHAIKQLVKKYGKNCFRSITSDRGKEFNCFREVEAMDIPFYFAAPYSSWQRGSNESSNGLLREFYPKGTLFSNVSQEDLDKSVLLIMRSQGNVLVLRQRWRCLQKKFPICEKCCITYCNSPINKICPSIAKTNPGISCLYPVSD